MRKKTKNRFWFTQWCTCSVFTTNRQHYWSLNEKNRTKRSRRYRKKKEVEVFLETDLNFYILQANSGVTQRNETKKNYVMIKLNVPKRVTLPNGRTFVACYERIPRDQLPPNIVMRRTYRQRAALRGRRRRRKAQQRQGIFDFIKKVAEILL